MKYLNLLLAITILTSLYSCDTSELKKSINNETISAKWVVNEDSDYKSFEFNVSGSYLVVKSSQSKDDDINLFGAYEIIDESTISLSNIGILKKAELFDSTFSFSMKPMYSPDETMLTTTKVEDKPISARTALLCRTWQMVSFGGKDVAGTDAEIIAAYFSSGVYFVNAVSSVNQVDGGLGRWKWKDEQENTLLYSWDENAEWNDGDYVDIIELSTDKLMMTEYENTSVMRPLSKTKSTLVDRSKNSLNSLGRSHLNEYTHFFCPKAQ